MKRSVAALVIWAILLTACQDMDWVTAVPNPSFITPTRLPNILSPTPILIYPTTSAPPTPSASFTPSLTSIPNATSSFTPTSPATETFTPSPTPSNTPQPLTIQLLGCNTSIDVIHGMGEVTNAYVTLVNASGLDLTAVCATLSSADEGRVHPDKTACIPSLPTGFQVTLKLTIDTTFRVDTVVNIEVKSNEGMFASTGGQTCKDIGLFKPTPETIGVLQPIP